MSNAVGRRPVLDSLGRRASDRPPSQRGYTSITVADPVFARLAAYMAQHGIKTKSAAVEHLLDHQTTAPSPIPWDEIESALISALGKTNKIRILSVIEELKTARQ